MQVCGGPALSMFSPRELELLVCGLPHLDFEARRHLEEVAPWAGFRQCIDDLISRLPILASQALQKATQYEGGYGPEHPVIKWFWEIGEEVRARPSLGFSSRRHRQNVPATHLILAVHGMSLEDKKRFLSFTTGCDRSVPDCCLVCSRAIPVSQPHRASTPSTAERPLGALGPSSSSSNVMAGTQCVCPLLTRASMSSCCRSMRASRRCGIGSYLPSATPAALACSEARHEIAGTHDCY